MKKIMMIACSIMFSLISFAQPTDTKGVHTFTSLTSLKVCNDKGVESGTEIPIEQKWDFRIVKILDDGYIIHLLLFPKKYTNADALNLKYYKDANGSSIYFRLSKVEYAKSAEKIQPRGTLTVGAATSIIKIRPGSNKLKEGYPVYFDFANDFSLGLMAGAKINSKREEAQVAHNILAGFGLTSIGVDSLTTRGFSTSKANNSAIYVSLGYVFEYNKFQFGVFGGYDFMAGEVGRRWIYRERPWIGLSLGFSIFNAQLTTGKQEKID